MELYTCPKAHTGTTEEQRIVSVAHEK